MRRALVPLAALLAASLAPSCATLGSIGEGDRDLPTAGVGPFRKLESKEVPGVAPFVLAGGRLVAYREPAALPLDPLDDGSARVALYAVSRGATGPAIVRTRADDGRAFFGTIGDRGHEPLAVLRPDAAWEGGEIGGPAPVHVGGEIFLYYAAKEGIGLARGRDGLSFTKANGPVLVRDPHAAWETTAPRAPSVARLPDGRLRMLYAAGASIGEAESDDGVTWRRVDGDPSTPELDPVLAPAAARAPSVPGEKPPFDTAQVTDPCLAVRVTPGARVHMRVLYTGYLDPPEVSGRQGAIGFAARYGDAGPLSRQVAPSLSIGKHEAAPSLFEWRGGSILYVEHDDPIDPAKPTLSVAGAFAPPTLSLPPPAAYPLQP